MLADSDWSEEDEAPYAYWETKSVLELHGAPRLAAPPRRPSQRSTAPSPSLAVTANGTPKLKRTTTNASLPSPSASGADLRDEAKALRQKKRRRAAAGKKRWAAPEPSAEPFDAETLEVLNQLAKKIQARSAGNGSPALGRTRASSLATASGATNSTARSPLRRATATSTADIATTTPLRHTPARTARQQQQPAAAAAQTLLNLSATKATRARSIAKPPSASATAGSRSPSTTATLLPTAVNASTDIPDRPVAVASKKKQVEAEEDYFDDDDCSFEAALSQLDVTHLVPTPSPQQPTVIAAAVPAPVPAPVSSQASDTLKAEDSAAGAATRAGPHPLPLPPLRKAESLPAPPPPARAAARRSVPASSRLNGARPVSASPPPRPHPSATKPSTATATTSTATVGVKSAPKAFFPSQPTRAQTVPVPVPVSGAGAVAKPLNASLVRTTSAPKLLSATERSALEALARKEMAALAELDDVDLWADDDPF
ncbi:hypothetical protein JCM3774_001435 [Rhodotorula dairenensis]